MKVNQSKKLWSKMIKLNNSQLKKMAFMRMTRLSLLTSKTRGKLVTIKLTQNCRWNRLKKVKKSAQKKTMSKNFSQRKRYKRSKSNLLFRRPVHLSKMVDINSNHPQNP